MKRLTIKDYPILKKFTDISDYHEYNSNPITMLMWDAQYHVYYETFEHFALVYTQEEGDVIEWLTPYCAKEYRHEALMKMKEYCSQWNIPFVFHSMNTEFKNWMLEHYPFTFFIYTIDGAQDYIYDIEAQRSLSGKKMQKRRNHFHAFEKIYGHRAQFKKLSHEDFDAIRTYLDEWKHTRDESLYESIDLERQGIELLLQHYDCLDLDGGVIYIDGKLEAFSMVSLLSKDTLQIHVEKANRNIRGLSVAIVKYYLDTLDSSVLYMNREDDMGIEALRKAKHDMQPIYMLPKYSAAYSNMMHRIACKDDDKNIRTLWSERFIDEDNESIDYYFQNLYQRETCHVLYHNETLISMLQVHPKTIRLDGIEYPAYFIFGVATHKEYEGCGYMKQMINAIMKTYGEDQIYLLQAYHPPIYYSLGFKESYFKYRYKISKNKYQSNGGTLIPNYDASTLSQLYSQYIQSRNGACIRSVEDYQNIILPSLTYYDEVCYSYILNNKVKGYIFVREDEIIEVSEIIYLEETDLFDILFLLSQSDKKVYVNTDAILDEKRKTISEMMVLNFSSNHSLFIHERI